MPTRTSTHAEVQSLQGLHLYHAQLSNSSMRVRLLLEEKGLAWTSHLLDATRQDNLTDSYLRINPTSLIPALVHDGVVVTESSDVLYYLEEHFPEPRLAPTDEGDRAEMRAWVDLAASSHPTTLKPWQYHVTGTRTKRPEDMERIVAAYRRREDVARYACVARGAEIEANDFNLNIPRYVDTFETDDGIDLASISRLISHLDEDLLRTQGQIALYLQELGL